MKIRISDFYSAYAALQALDQKRLSVRALYWVSRILISLRSEFMMIQSVRNELLATKYKVFDGDTNEVKPEEIAAFLKEFSPFFSDEIDIAFEPISSVVFDDCKLSPEEIAGLGQLITQSA